MALLKPRVDLLEILEAAYTCERDELSWAQQLIGAVRGALATAQATGVIMIAHRDNFLEPTPVFTACTDPELDRLSMELWSGPAIQALRASPELMRMFYPGQPHTTHSELEPLVAPETGRVLAEFRRGAPDAFALMAYPASGVALALWSLLDVVPTYARGERRLLDRIAAHVDSAFRLRMLPEAAIGAVLSPDGKLLDLEDPDVGPKQGELARQVRSIEHSRLSSQRRKPDALDQWRALIDGKYSVVPREDSDGKRHYLLILNAPVNRAHARLSGAEVNVLSFAARGFSGKGTAYALGVSEASVSTVLARVAAKLGLRSRAELVQVGAALFGVSSESVSITALSPAERDIFDLLRRGLSNAEIAALRARSPNTVANQIASILRKTASRSRRDLWHSRLKRDD